MARHPARGFSLIEVVLAIAVGLVIMGGICIGYYYVRRSSIVDNQRRDVATIRVLVEQFLATAQANMSQGATSNCVDSHVGACAPPLTTDQLGQWAARMASLRVDPYTGATRVDNDGHPACVQRPGSCISSIDLPGDADPSTIPDVALSSNMGELLQAGWRAGDGAGLAYVYSGRSAGDSYRVTLADGTTRTFYGYMVLASDPDGAIVAADGGDASLAQHR